MPFRRKTAMGSAARIELFPPIGEIRDTACHVYGFPYNRGNQMKGFALAGGGNPLEWFVPRMVGQREFADMRGEQMAGPKVFRRLSRFFRRHMDMAPAFVILAAVQKGEVNAAEAFSQFSEMRPVSAVAAEKDLS